MSWWCAIENGGKVVLSQLIFLLYLIRECGDLGVEFRIFGSHLSSYSFEYALLMEELLEGSTVLGKLRSMGGENIMR